jgi:hypothetical protein
MQRLRFAGWEAAIGVFVLGAFAVFAALGLLGLAALALTGQVAFGRDVAFGLVVLAGAVGVLGVVVVRGQRQFRTLEIADDGTWILRDSLGCRLGQIAPDAERSLVELRRETWMYIGTARKYTQSWFELVSGSRTYHSCHSIPKFQAPAREALGRWLKP